VTPRCCSAKQSDDPVLSTLISVVDHVAYACLGGAMTVATLGLLARRHARVVRACVAALRRVVPLSVTYFIYVTAVVALIVVCFSADRSGH